MPPAPAPTPNDELRQLATEFANPRDAPVLDVLADRRRLAARLSTYEFELIEAARTAGHTWAEIGEASGMARQNAQRKFRQVELRRRRKKS